MSRAQMYMSVSTINSVLCFYSVIQHFYGLQFISFYFPLLHTRFIFYTHEFDFVFVWPVQISFLARAKHTYKFGRRCLNAQKMSALYQIHSFTYTV